MEYVVVRFHEPRQVNIDGNVSGETNKILRVGAGTHVFDLGSPKDYQPIEVKREIKDTNSLDPAIVEFQEVSV
jgi:hypothetical protein